MRLKVEFWVPRAVLGSRAQLVEPGPAVDMCRGGVAAVPGSASGVWAGFGAVEYFARQRQSARGECFCAAAFHSSYVRKGRGVMISARATDLRHHGGDRSSPFELESTRLRAFIHGGARGR